MSESDDQMLTTTNSPKCAFYISEYCLCVQLVGKWIFHVGSVDPEEQMKELKTINSSWIEISAISDSDEMTLHWEDKMYLLNG